MYPAERDTYFSNEAGTLERQQPVAREVTGTKNAVLESCGVLRETFCCTSQGVRNKMKSTMSHSLSHLSENILFFK
jgi:hypothetical protein